MERIFVLRLVVRNFSYIFIVVKLIIFTYSPTGLGHLRVTDALAGARPKDRSYVILGSFDKWMNWMHRVSSINPIAKYIFLSSQKGLFEDILTYVYRYFLVLTSASVYKQIIDIIKNNPDVEDFQIVATHPGLAHQIGAIKEKLAKDTGKKISFIVQVTDDTYQHIWLIRGADLTIVPSHFVKEKFDKYAKEQKIKFVAEVVPYPIDNTLTNLLPTDKKRIDTFADTVNPINIVVPISGAAVGLPYLIDLIRRLVKLSGRFKFWVIVRKASYTDFFVRMLLNIPGVNVVIGDDDNQMISLYELVYQQNLIHIEITKPSEQAFKAIIEPSRVGGSILLLAAPLGRQETENIEFLQRHNLVANIDKLTTGQSFFLRSLILGSNAAVAAENIQKCVSGGIFKNMVDDNFSFASESVESGEVGADGASVFWKIVEEYFD